MASKPPVLISEAIQRKEFSYTVGPIGLKFTLRTDIKGELKTFKTILEKAIADIGIELEAMKK